MMTPTILYKEIPKWVDVGGKNAQKAFQFIYFNGEKVYATDSHSMVVVKNIPCAEAHYETPEGIKTDPEIAQALEYEKIIPKDNLILWRHEMSFIPSDLKVFLDDWKMVFDICKKVTRKTKHHALYLKKEYGKLYVYSVNERVKVKVLLLEGLPEDKDDKWEMSFNVGNLVKIMDFLKATEPRTIEMRITKTANPVLIFETEDLLMLIACMNVVYIQNEWDYKTLTNFVASEPITPPPAPEIPEESEDSEADADDDEFLD